MSEFISLKTEQPHSGYPVLLAKFYGEPYNEASYAIGTWDAIDDAWDALDDKDADTSQGYWRLWDTHSEPVPFEPTHFAYIPDDPPTIKV